MTFEGGASASTVHPSSLVLSAVVAEHGGSQTIVVALRSATTYQQLWSRKYSLADKDYRDGDWLTDIARHVAVNVAGSTGPAVRHALEQSEHEPESADPIFLAMLKGFRYLSSPTPAEHAKLRDEFERLLGDRPLGAAANAMLARIYCDSETYRFNKRESDNALFQKSLVTAQAAVSQNPTSSFAWRVLASIRYELRELERARAAAKRATELNRNDTEAMAFSGICYWDSGDFETGLQYVHEALRLSDHPPSWYKVTLVHEEIRCARYEAALDMVADIEIGPFFWIYFLEAIIFGHLGRADEFVKTYKSLQTVAPWLLTVLYEASGTLFFPDDFIEQCLAGLSKGCALSGIGTWGEGDRLTH